MKRDEIIMKKEYPLQNFALECLFDKGYKFLKKEGNIVVCIFHSFCRGKLTEARIDIEGRKTYTDISIKKNRTSY